MNYRYVTAAAGAASLIGFVLLWRPGDVEVASKAPNDVVPTPMAVLVQRSVSPRQAQQSADPPQSQVLPAERQSEKFDRLVATGKPIDAFAAYQISAECVASRWWQDKQKQLQDPSAIYGDLFKGLPPPGSACGDLSPGQIGTRVELLRRSAAAGVHGAYAALNLESPAGILQGLSLTEWLQLSEASFAAGLSTADPMTLIERSGRAANCPNVPLCSNPSGDDFAEALKYLIAFRESQMRDAGPFKPEQERALQAAISRYSVSLSPDVVARSLTDGKALVEAAKAP